MTQKRIVIQGSVKREFVPEDWTIPLRTVGSFEYTNALIDFDQLVEMSSKEEIDVFNKIILEQEEYAFFSGSDLAPLDQVSDSVVEEFPDSKNRTTRKHGLQWMLALARVEVGATVAMYGHAGNGFELLRPAEFAFEEYSELVATDAIAHTKALGTDRAFNERVQKGKKVDSDTVAYLRRLKLVNDMVEYVRNNAREDVASSTGELLVSLRKARKELSNQAGDATIDVSYRREGTETGSRNRNSNEVVGYGDDIVARSPITRACQRLFLERQNGR